MPVQRRKGALCAAVAIIWSVLISLSLRASAASAPLSTGPRHYEELLVAVSINTASATDSTLVLKDDLGAYYAGADDVAAWKLVQTSRRWIEYHGQRYFALDDFKATFDADRGLLALTAPASVFELNVIDLQSTAQEPLARPALERGGFLNYDINSHVGTQRAGVSGFFNGAYTLLNGVASASAVQPGNGSGFVRLNTTFERDDLPQHTVLRIGDAVEAGGILQGRQFGGVQWGTDFALAPSFSTIGLPVFAGSLPTDGTLDVIINGNEVSQQQIPAGPFLLQNLPVSGSGSVTLVLRDASGRVQTIVSPYYQSPILLRQGVSQFEFDAGSERQRYGSVSNSYGGMFVSAQGRRGVSRVLTLGGAVDGSAHSQTGSVAADYLLPVIGQVAATFTGRTGVDPGLQQTYTYSYPGRHFALGGQLMKSSPLYNTVSYQLLANLSVPAGKSSSLSLSYSRSITSDGILSRTAAIAYGRSLWDGQLNFNVLHSGPSPTTAVTATYAMKLGARGYVAVSAVNNNGQSEKTVSYTQSLPNSATGFAYQMQADMSASGGTTYNINATEQLTKATVTQQVFHGQDTTLFTTDVAGSIALVDGAIGAARTIGGGFGVVELPGYPGVGVYANGQELGRTDGRGRLILAQLQPYQNNEITVAGQDLPIGVDLVTSAVQIAPYGLSPGIARFVVKSAGGVTLTLVDPKGAVLPAGTTVASADRKHHWLLAFDGQAYLEGVAAGEQRFTATTAIATCSFALSIPKDTAQLPDLGRTVCQ